MHPRTIAVFASMIAAGLVPAVTTAQESVATVIERGATAVHASPVNSAQPAGPQIFVSGDGVRINYQIDGPADKPVLVLSNSIATNFHMWDGEIPAFTKHFRVLRYDTRGNGMSDAPTGAYSVARLGRDVLELLDSLSIENAHFLGISLGGFVGQWLGVHAPERINRLVLANTAPYLGPAGQWDQAIEGVLAAPNMEGTAEMFLHNWFPVAMLESNPPIVDEFRSVILATSRQGLAGSYAAVRDADMRRTITLIPNPTLVIAGEHDTVTAASYSADIAAAIPHAKLVTFPAVHLTNIEYPVEFHRIVLQFLTAGNPEAINFQFAGDK